MTCIISGKISVVETRVKTYLTFSDWVLNFDPSVTKQRQWPLGNNGFSGRSTIGCNGNIFPSDIMFSVKNVNLKYMLFSDSDNFCSNFPLVFIMNIVRYIYQKYLSITSCIICKLYSQIKCFKFINNTLAKYEIGAFFMYETHNKASRNGFVFFYGYVRRNDLF